MSKVNEKIKNKIVANQDKIRIILTIITSTITTCVMVFSLFTTNSLPLDAPETGFDEVFRGFFFLTFLFLALSRIPLVIRAIRSVPSKISLIKNIVFVLIFTCETVLIDVLPLDTVNICTICAIYLFTIAANRICICIERKKVISYIFNITLAALAIAAGAVSLLFTTSDIALVTLVVSLTLVIIMLVSIGEILSFAFSRIQLKGIVKIIKKTYAFEVLYGLVVLIIAFSFYFSITEDGIKTYMDGLWYSFAVVTTIGFGDFTVTGVIGRILSMILGFYGIVVVAVITSIIVNYYNEVKDEKEEKKNKTLEEKENDSEKNPPESSNK